MGNPQASCRNCSNLPAPFKKGATVCGIIKYISHLGGLINIRPPVLPLAREAQLRNAIPYNPPSRQVPRHLSLKREARGWKCPPYTPMLCPLKGNTQYLSPFCKGGTVSAANERGIENISPYYKPANKINKAVKGFPHIKAVGRRRGVGGAEPRAPSMGVVFLHSLSPYIAYII